MSTDESLSPEVRQVCARMDEYLAAIAKATEEQQKVVGHGMNNGSAFMVKEFGSVASFRTAGRTGQLKFLDRLNAMVQQLEPTHMGIAWGLRIFWVYARLLMEEDPHIASRYFPEVARLGKLGATLARQ
ncbi:MAG TPA: hypothetical protein VFV90_08375 [Usitatibacter sp.]|nr:hypothetical protein [Usitatibacter sp.]